MISEHMQHEDAPLFLTRKDVVASLARKHAGLSKASYSFQLDKLLKAGQLVRVGHNAYQVSGKQSNTYSYAYSDISCRIAEILIKRYPLVDFRIFEMVQLNDFVNHLLAHNTIFVSAENDVLDFVFNTLQAEYPGKVLLRPSLDGYHRYRTDDMIVLERLLTEAPRGDQSARWHTSLEKLLVDVVADKFIRSSISPSEYEFIFQDAFELYTIDERKMFRYARRRNAEKKIRKIIAEQTNVKLRMEPSC
jgi:hypothetical protein